MAEGRTTGLRRAVRGIRFRTTAVATLAVFVVLVSASGLLVVGLERSLTSNLDESLESDTDALESTIESDGVPDTVGGMGDDDSAVQIVDRDGRVLVATPNISGATALAAAPESEHITASRHLPHEDGPFRILSRQVEGPDGEVVVHVAASSDDIEESTETLVASLFVTVPMVVVVLGGLVWVLVGRTLRPVEDIRAEVSSINASELGRRVPEPSTDDEIARLARTMNAMLERVERSVARQQRFVADASHELRTPLARLRSEVEVDLAHPAPADLVATHHSVLDEATALEGLLDDLLYLARLDAAEASAPVAGTLVDLDDVVFRCIDQLANGRVVNGRDVHVDVSGVSPVQVLGREPQLTRAVSNVIDNAGRYAASVVACRLSEQDGHAVLAIVDDGPGIAAADRERVFERFTRLDDSRTASTGGTGLGLAIARDIIVRHGGSIGVDPGGGGRFTIRLPSAGT